MLAHTPGGRGAAPAWRGGVWCCFRAVKIKYKYTTKKLYKNLVI